MSRRSEHDRELAEVREPFWRGAGPGERLRPPTDLVVLGCVAGKGRAPAPARVLYCSPLWERRRAYAEASGLPWLIYSAWHGLVEPGEVIAPYDETLAKGRDRKRRSRKLAVPAAARIAGIGAKIVELHMGADYYRELKAELEARGVRVFLPLGVRAIGEQLAWYNRELDRRAECEAATQRELFSREEVGG